jgi:hypothetical protein
METKNAPTTHKSRLADMVADYDAAHYLASSGIVDKDQPREDLIQSIRKLAHDLVGELEGKASPQQLAVDKDSNYKRRVRNEWRDNLHAAIDRW